LKKSLEEAEAKASAVEDLTTKLATVTSERDEARSEMIKETKKSETEMMKMSAVINELRSEAEKMTKEVLTAKENIEDTIPLSTHNFMLKEKEDEMKDLNEKMSGLSSEVEELKSKNNNLREKNWKAMDAVAMTEENARSKISQLQGEVNDVKSSVKSSLSQAFPDAGSDTEDFDLWLTTFVSNITSSVTSGQQSEELDEMKVKEEKMNVQLLALQTSLDSALQRSKVTEAELEESKRTNEAKNSEVESYKAILQATELTLSQLQSTVENEESKYEEKMKKTSEELEKLQKELEASEKKFELQSSEVSQLQADREQLLLEKDQMKTQLEELSKSRDVQVGEIV